MPLIDDGYAALGDIRRALNEGEELGCHLFLNSRPTRERREPWHRVSLERALADRFSDRARQALSELEGNVTDEQLLAEFDFDAMVDGSVGVLNVRETPGLTEWLAALPEPDWPTIYNGDEEVLKRSRFFAYRLSVPGGRQVKAFRGRGGLEITARQRHAVAAIFQRDNHEMIAVEGSVVSFDPTPDFFEWDGLLFIINMRTFESITDIREITVRKAGEAMDALAARFQIDNLEDLKQSVSQRTRLGKRLASAHKYGLVGDLNAERVVELIGVRGLQLACAPQGERLRFDVDHRNGRAVEDFVDLVSDVFLVSPTTRRDWEALVKRPPRRR